MQQLQYTPQQLLSTPLHAPHAPYAPHSHTTPPPKHHSPTHTPVKNAADGVYPNFAAAHNILVSD